MTGTRTRGGFVFRAVEGARDLFDDAPVEDAADYVPALTRRLFDDVLGYETVAYSQREQWGEVTFVDDDGRPAIVLAAVGPGEDVRRARRRAVAALDEEPTASYAVATNRDRLVVLARCSPDHPDAVTRTGVTTRELTDVNLRAAVERSDDRSLAEALTPGQQLSMAKLTALRRETVSAALDDPDAVDPEPTLGDLTLTGNAPETTPDRLAETLTETFEGTLLPAVSAAFDRLTHRIQEFADREAAVEERIEAAKAAGDETLVTDLRADLFDLREGYATARRLEAGFARWRRVVDDGSEADAAERFAAESAAVALDTLFLARAAADRGLAGDRGSAGEYWDERAGDAGHNASDLGPAARDELAAVSEDATDDGTFAWVFEADVDEALADAITALSAVDVDDLDAEELTEAFDTHLDADARPVRGATRPSTAGLLLDRADYTPDATIDDPDADLLDPACGDGSLLVGAADRLLARLDRTDATPAETLETVRDRLHGFDAHPYAVHLAESRLLLRTVDVHADAALAEDEFSLGRFGVHRTDALRERETVAGIVAGKRARRREEAAAVKSRDDFGYVVSDAPTGRVTDRPSETLRSGAEVADRSALFLERAADWLTDGGQLSMAVDGGLLTDETAAETRSRLTESFRLRELVAFDTGSATAPLFVAAERDGGADTEAFTYARVTPTFIELVRQGLLRPGSDDATSPATLVSRSLPDVAGGDPPSMETVLVELDLVCDATVEGPMPVSVQSVAGDELADGPWTFSADEETAEEAAVSPLDGDVPDETELESPRSRLD